MTDSWGDNDDTGDYDEWDEEESFPSSQNSYGVIAKTFHWIIALLIFGMILLGFYMKSLAYSPDKLELYSWHKSFGFMVLWLASLRIIWRHIKKPPPALDTHKSWENILSKITHVFLYIAMFGMPLTGWLMSSAGEYPIKFFGLQMPALMGKNPDVAGLMNLSHQVLAYMLIIAIGLHSLGALKHHLIDGDFTLKRMAPKFLFPLWQFVIFFALVALVFGVVKLGVLPKLQTLSKQEEIRTVEIETTPKPVVKRPTHQWKIEREQSTITFFADVYETNFTGTLNNFDGMIFFDPKNLSQSKVDVQINLKSVNSGDANRDAQIMGDQWLNVVDHPTARFETLEFQQVAQGKYITVGNLTLAGKTMPVTVPFTLDIVEAEEGRRAYMSAQTSLNRLSFDLGGEQWSADDVVGHEVDISIRLVAQNILK